MLEKIKILLSLSLCLSVSRCGSTNIPPYNGKIYAGNHETETVDRAQSGESIPTNDPWFSKTIIFTSEDFKLFYETYVEGCREWKSGDLVKTESEIMKHFPQYFPQSVDK